MNLHPGDVVALLVNTSPDDNRQKVYARGTQYRFVRHTTATTRTTTRPLAMVREMATGELLLFHPADLERVAAGATTVDG